MELTETIDSLNRQLADLFGIDTITGQPIWRIVWSEDQFEKRRTEFTREGLRLMYPEVLEMPKYPWIKEKYVLERLVLVPKINEGELPTQVTSYEPMYPFQDNNGNYLPPKIEISKLVINSVYAAQGKGSLAKYADEESTPEAKLKRLQQLEQELYGNETEVGDALAHGEAITVPRNYEKES